MRRLRLRTEVRTLWIDQLSINQNEEAKHEKAEQIPLMGLIYAQANYVLVWLGDTPDTNKRTGAFDGGNWDDLDGHRSNQLKHALTNTFPSWPSRAWVLQEYVMAWYAPKFCFGPYVQDWAGVSQDTIGLNALISSKVVGFHTQLMAFEKARARRDNHTLLALAWTIGRTNCLNMRDKVFCLLSLLSAEQRSLVRINYDCPDALVFAEATFAEITTTKSLIILSLTGRTTDEYISRPSWVLDFALPFDALGVPTGYPAWYRSFLSWTRTFTAANDMQDVCSALESFMGNLDPWTRCHPQIYASPTFDTNRMTLLVQALQFDTVGVTLPPVDAGWKDSFEMAGRRSSYASCLTTVEMAYQKLLHVDNVAITDLRKCETCNQSLTALSLLYHVCDWEAVTRTGSISWKDITLGMYVKYNSHIHGSCTVFVTATGFYGFGPPKMHMSDLVVLPYGSRFPMALRRSEDGMTWRLLGHVYVFGIMNGELVTKLPDLELQEREFILR